MQSSCVDAPRRPRAGKKAKYEKKITEENQQNNLHNVTTNNNLNNNNINNINISNLNNNNNNIALPTQTQTIINGETLDKDLIMNQSYAFQPIQQFQSLFKNNTQQQNNQQPNIQQNIQLNTHQFTNLHQNFVAPQQPDHVCTNSYYFIYFLISFSFFL